MQGSGNHDRHIAKNVLISKARLYMFKVAYKTLKMDSVVLKVHLLLFASKRGGSMTLQSAGSRCRTKSRNSEKLSEIAPVAQGPLSNTYKEAEGKIRRALKRMLRKLLKFVAGKLFLSRSDRQKMNVLTWLKVEVVVVFLKKVLKWLRRPPSSKITVTSSREKVFKLESPQINRKRAK